MHKYIVIKRDTEDGRIYIVHLHTDEELAVHIRGTIDNTDHVIVSVTNTSA